MTATPLSSGPFTGVLTGNSASPSFSSTPGQASAVQTFISPLAKGSAVSLLRSTDGGATWHSVGGLTFTDTTSALYKVQGTIAAGSACFIAYEVTAAMAGGGLQAAAFSAAATTNLFRVIEPNTAPDGITVNMTTSQLATLYQARLTPLGASDIAGALTLYKRGHLGEFITVQIPTNAQRALEDPSTQYGVGWYGPSRVVRASSVTVTSVVDQNGNAVSQALSDICGGELLASTQPPKVIYTVGETVNAYDFFTGGGPITDFQLRHNVDWQGNPITAPMSAGISGFVTAIEAANYVGNAELFFTNGVLTSTVPAPANLAALGL